MTRTVEEARGRFLRAIQAEAYEEAERILAAYSQAVAEMAGNRGAADPGRREQLQRAVDTLCWSSRLVRSSRAHLAKEMARLAASRPYRILAHPLGAKVELVG